jgi:hypothetical protein
MAQAAMTAMSIADEPAGLNPHPHVRDWRRGAEPARRMPVGRPAQIADGLEPSIPI